MAGDIKEKFGTAGQAITCSLAPSGTGLASGSARASTAVDNTTNLYDDALVSVTYKTASGTISGQKAVNVYAFATSDGGTRYTEGASGTDGPITLVSPTNLFYLGTIACPAASTTYSGGPWSVAGAFNGPLPAGWGIVVENQTGVAADGTESNHAKTYQGVYRQYT